MESKTLSEKNLSKSQSIASTVEESRSDSQIAKLEDNRPESGMIQRLQDMTKSDSNPDIESLPLDDLSTANLNLPDRQEEKDFDFVDDEFEQGKIQLMDMP